MMQRALGVLTRRRYPGEHEVSRWTVRPGGVPEDAEAIVLLSVEEIAVNELRETFHRWVRTLAFPVRNGELGEPLAHVPAHGRRAADGLKGALDPDDRRRAGEILEDASAGTRIRQGRGGTRAVVPMDFSDLSSEYIGILYEGLLDYELKTAPPGDPVIFLAVGHQPALPLSRLEAMDDRALQELFEDLGKAGAAATGDEDSQSEDGAEGEDGEDEDQLRQHAGADLFGGVRREREAGAPPLEVRDVAPSFTSDGGRPAPAPSALPTRRIRSGTRARRTSISTSCSSKPLTSC